MTNHRKPDYPIHDMFLERWSPRAFTSQPITQEELLTMLEAARWAASDPLLPAERRARGIPGMRSLRRVEKLESRLSSAVSSDPLRFARSEAFDRLEHSDRKMISELARKYQAGEHVEDSLEIRECMARWGDLIAASQNQIHGARGRL